MTQSASHPSIEPWQLTAYALNELEPSDAAKVELALETDVALRGEFEQIQQTLTAVRTAFASTAANVGLSDTQTAVVSSQFAQTAAPNAVTAGGLPPVATIKLAERPFYRRKRFAALLATAAAIPLAATWMPSLYENGGPFTLHDTGFVLSRSDLNAEVQLSRESDSSVAAMVDSSASMKAPSLSNEGMDSVDAATEIPALSGLGFVQLYNPGSEEREKIVASDDAVASVSEQPSDIELPFGSESKQQASIGRKNDLALDKRRSLGGGSSSGGMGFGMSGGMGSGSSGPSGSSSDALGNRSATLKESVIPGNAGGDSMSGASRGGSMGGMSGGGMSSGGMSGGPGAGSPIPLRKSASASAIPSLELESMPHAIHDKRIKDSEDRQPIPLYRLPEDLRQNAPHLFRAPATEPSGTDRFEKIVETPFLETQKAPLSTFSIDVDTASYSKIRQTIMEGNRLPSPNMVRIEEMVNYFEYGYAGPQDERPFAAHMSVDRCPWNTEHQLVRVGLQAKKIDKEKRVKANIVFLLDVSGSMNEPNKLPLVKKSLSMMVNQLNENDRVAIVVYAGAAGCVLPSTCGAEKQAILSSLDHLNAGGSTNGGQGIQLAYSIAKEHFIPGGANRVVLCTDGDFNVGVTGDDALVAMMQENAKSNVFLTCLGFGAGNYNDTMMEKISNKGNGIYGMIDNELEGRRMMVEQLGGTLVTVAKDVKIQVDFNPAKVAGYRLIGYEDRRLANKDFDNDQKDAGEIGAGHRVTALYEVIPAGKWVGVVPPSEGETSKYLKNPMPDTGAQTSTTTEFPTELLTLKVRYKEPEGSVSTKQEFVLKDTDRGEQPLVDRDMQWATSVAEFGLLLRRSEMAPHADWTEMLERAASSAGGDAYRLECLAMMRKARSMFR